MLQTTPEPCRLFRLSISDDFTFCLPLHIADTYSTITTLEYSPGALCRRKLESRFGRFDSLLDAATASSTFSTLS